MNINPKAFEVVDVVKPDPRGFEAVDENIPTTEAGTSSNSLNLVGVKWDKPSEITSSTKYNYEILYL